MKRPKMTPKGGLAPEEEHKSAPKFDVITRIEQEQDKTDYLERLEALDRHEIKGFRFTDEGRKTLQTERVRKAKEGEVSSLDAQVILRAEMRRELKKLKNIKQSTVD